MGWNTDISTGQYNALGQVAIAYYQTVNPMIEVPGGTSYKFVTKANICLAWVNEEHAENILARTKKCCGNNHKKVFRVASEADVRRWSGISGR